MPARRGRTSLPDDLATAVAGAFLARWSTVRQAAGEIAAGRTHRRHHRPPDPPGDRPARARARDVDWSRIDFCWGDERFVAADSDERNAPQAREAFLDQLGVDPARVHECPSTDDADSVGRRGRVVRRDGARHGATARFDLLMLGVGPDGHVASLFPGFPQLDVDDPIAVAVTGSPKPPPERVSLTFAALNRSDEVWFVVSGADKAEAVGRALGSSRPPCTRSPPSASAAGSRPPGSSTATPRPRSRNAESAQTGTQNTPVGSCRPGAASLEDDVAGLAAAAEQLDGLVEDRLGLGVGAALLHVGQVGLVGLDLRRRRRVLGVEARRQPALAGSPTSRGRPRRPRTSPPSGARGSRSR